MEQEELRTPAGDGEEIDLPVPGEVAAEVGLGESEKEEEEVGMEGMEQSGREVTPLEAIEVGLEALAINEAGGAAEEAPTPPTVEPLVASQNEADAAITSVAQVEGVAPAAEPTKAPAEQNDTPGVLPVDAGRLAADALAVEYRKLPGVVAGLISGNTVEEVASSLEAARKAFGDVKAQVLKELGVGVPAARSGSGPAPMPSTPLGMIEAGLATVQSRRNGSR
jgi:hypothetical protein